MKTEKNDSSSVPKNVLRIAMNVLTYPYSIIHKYDTLILPTLTEEDLPLLVNNGEDHPLIALLCMSLALGGSSRITNEPKIKILLWNCRGCNNKEFRCNFKDIINWNNPSIICSRMQSHYDLMEFISFTGLFEISTDGFLGGVVLIWKQEELEKDPGAVTDQEIHDNIQVSRTSKPWLLFMVYASPILVNGKILWSNLEIVAKNNKHLWKSPVPPKSLEEGPSTIKELLPF